MKNSVYIFTLFFLITVGCSSQNETETGNTTTQSSDSITVESVTTVPAENTNPTSEHPLGDAEKMDYTEYYENGAVKIIGNYDDDGERNGLWISYYDNGIKWSESYYLHGLKSGHSITFFPNGKVRYVGEYQEDKMIGTWTFYDEEGNLVKEETH